MINGIIPETFKTTNIPDLNRNQTRPIPLMMSSYAEYKIDFGHHVCEAVNIKRSKPWDEMWGKYGLFAHTRMFDMPCCTTLRQENFFPANTTWHRTANELKLGYAFQKLDVEQSVEKTSKTHEQYLNYSGFLHERREDR